jgi:hypothetical protein
MVRQGQHVCPDHFYGFVLVCAPIVAFDVGSAFCQRPCFRTEMAKGPSPVNHKHVDAGVNGR